LVVKIVVFL